MSASLIDEVVLATTTSAADDPLAAIGQSMGVRIYRGIEEDVLARFVGALAGDQADVVVRHVGDAPLVDPGVINSVVGHFLKGDCDYASNMIERSWPRGSESEVLSREALYRSHQEGTRPEDREHVTIYARTHADRFRLRNVKALPQETWPELRLTLDMREDLALFEKVFDELYVPGHLLRIGAVIDWLRQHPEVVALNAHLKQKTVFGKDF